jgi:hypothetical protein
LFGSACRIVIKKIFGPFAEFGLLAGFLYLLDRLLIAASPDTRLFVYELMVQPISDKPLLKGPPNPIELRQIMRGDSVLDRIPIPRDVVASRFQQDAVCFGAFRKETFVGYIWFSFDGYEEDETRCTYVLSPAGESVFDFDLYIFPEYRLGRAFVGIWEAAMKMLHGRGIRYSFSRLTRFNTASRRAHAHLRWKLVGRAIFLKLWGLECMAATVSPYVSLSRRRRPALRLRADALQNASRGGPLVFR